MTHEIRKLMVSYKILNEGELFCTNLAFNLDDEQHTKLIGDPGQKDEDAVKALNMKIKLLMEEYQTKMRIMLENRQYHRIDFAKAIYFTAYYNPDNHFFMRYCGRFFVTKKKLLGTFINFWNKHRENETAFDRHFHEQLQEFSIYKKNLKKSKMSGGSDDKIMNLLIHKQFFSIPWLLCYNDYLA